MSVLSRKLLHKKLICHSWDVNTESPIKSMDYSPIITYIKHTNSTYATISSNNHSMLMKIGRGCKISCSFQIFQQNLFTKSSRCFSDSMPAALTMLCQLIRVIESKPIVYTTPLYSFYCLLNESTCKLASVVDCVHQLLSWKWTAHMIVRNN
mgnify:CR=1 FL=1